MQTWLSRRSDSSLALICAAVLFALCAWPLLLVDVPPFQDVANHLAVTSIIEHPENYPDYVFTGFVKTNAAFYAWEYYVGRAVGAYVAIRTFVALVFAVSALVLTRLLLVMGDRKKLLVGTLFIAPMIHNWCVALGLLDFALGFPLALLLLVEMVQQRKNPTPRRAMLIALTSIVAWYAHVIPLFLAHIIVFVELVVTALRSRAEAKRFFVTTILPIFPGTALMTMSVLLQITRPAPIKLVSRPNIWLPPWDLAYNLWAEWFWSFTYATLPTIVPCIVLAVIAWRRRKERVTFFEPAAFFVLATMYAFIPYVIGYWAYANTRVAPFLWLAALVRLPPRLPKWLVVILASCTLSYSVGLGVEYVRLDREQREYKAGIASVPEHAKLLPLVFESKGVAINTRPLSHTWGFYVFEKQTTAPLVFASSRLYGVTYRVPPEPQLEHIALERFTGEMRDPKLMCRMLENDIGVHVGDCTAQWRATWRAFWDLVEPRYDWLLLWDPTPIVETAIPPEYAVVFRQGRLVILHRPPMP